MADTELAAGDLFAEDFIVVKKLDRGGMGAVYEVEQRSTGRRRALKVLHAEVAQSPRNREAFLREARVGSRIESEHVVEVIAAGIDPASERPWLVMELLVGETLARRVKSRGPLRGDELMAIYRPIAHSLSAAHRVGVIHCDLKPENVFLCETKRADVGFTVKVLDFGIAKVVQEYRTSVLATSAEGTPRWMAPEQTVRNGRIKPATDVWALGLMAFYLLTGTYYWRCAQVSQGVVPLLVEVARGPMPPASERAREHGASRELPPGFDAWFARCVARDLDARFPEATEAVEALAACFSARGSPVSRVPGTMVLPEGEPEANAERLALSQAEAAYDYARCVEFGERLARRPGRTAEDVSRLVRARVACAGSCEQSGDRRAALAHVDRAIELAPTDVSARYTSSVLRTRALDLTGALDDIERAVAVPPVNLAVSSQRARVLHLLGRYADAVAQWSALTLTEPLNPAWPLACGVSCAVARDFVRAEHELSRALSLAPHEAEVWWHRGVVRAERGDLTGALADIDEALRHAPHTGSYWYERSRVCRQLGDPVQAQHDLARAAELGHALALVESATVRA